MMKKTAFLLTVLLASVSLLHAAEVTTEFSEQGLTSLRVSGHEVLKNGMPVVRRIVLSDQYVDLNTAENPYGADPRSFSRGETEATKTTIDADDVTVRQVYAWGTLTVRYENPDGRLKMSVRVQNTGEKTIEMIRMDLAKIYLPGEEVKPRVIRSEPGWARDRANVAAPLIVATEFAAGKVVLAGAAPGGPLRYDLMGKKKPKPFYDVRVTLGHEKGGAELYDGQWLARPIAPGKADEFTVSLRFGPADADVLGMTEDVTSAFAERYPFMLEWPDRRPIGAVHVADNRTSPANPRGWKHGISVPKGWDIREDEGYERFHRGVIEGAEKTVRTARAGGFQGVVVWQIEGQEFGKAAYYGEPRLLPYVAPEMEGIADEYFRILREAGLRVGICIRPLIFAPLDAEGNVTSWAKVEKIKGRNWVDPAKDPAYQPAETPFGKEEAQSVVERLDAKIRYARDRWDCTLFYIDTNHFWRPRERGGEKWKWANKMLPAEVFRELHRRHPDVLLIPEHENLKYWSATAPYRQPPGYGGVTPRFVRAVYPRAFSVLNAHPTKDHVQNNMDWYLSGIDRGDIQMVHGWFGGGVVGKFYRKAAWRAPWRLHLAPDGTMTLGRQRQKQSEAVPEDVANALDIDRSPRRPEMTETVEIDTLAALKRELANRLGNIRPVPDRAVWISYERPPDPARLRQVIDAIASANGIIRWSGRIQ